MTETTRQRAIEDVNKELEPFTDCDADVEYGAAYFYAAEQRERVLILEAENAELKAKLEGK